MAKLGKTINPNPRTDLRHERAQGANVGDMAYGPDNILYRWDGVNWTQEPRHMQDRVTIPMSAEEKLAQERQIMEQEYQKLLDRYNKFVTDNPFTFDDLLARASSEERFNPFYEAELKEFLEAINLRRENVESEQELITELNDLAATQEKRGFEEAVRKSEEGFAGSGLFFGGQRRRQTGLKSIDLQEQTQERQARYQRGQEVGQIELGQLGVQEQQEQRRKRDELEAQIQSDISKQETEEKARYGQELSAHLYPLATRTSQNKDLYNILMQTYK